MESAVQEVHAVVKLIFLLVIVRGVWAFIEMVSKESDRRAYKRTQRDKQMDTYYASIRMILNKLRWKYKINYKNKENNPEGADGFYNKEMMAELGRYNEALLTINEPFLMIKFASITCDKIDKEMGRKKKKAWDKRPRDSHR